MLPHYPPVGEGVGAGGLHLRVLQLGFTHAAASANKIHPAKYEWCDTGSLCRGEL